MQRVINSNITLTRGDTFRANLVLTDCAGDPYVPDEGDVIRFAMKEDYKDKVAIVSKIIPNDTMILQLNPEDTKSIRPGKYVYDIRIIFANGDVDTFINRALFTIVDEVDINAL